MTGGGRKGSRGFPTAPLEKHIPIQRALNTNHIYKSTVSALFSLVSDAFSRAFCVWRAVCRVCLRVCSCGLSRMFAVFSGEIVPKLCEIVLKLWFTVLRSEFSKNCFIFVNHIGHKVPRA